MKLKIIKGPLKAVSKKDLIACTNVLTKVYQNYQVYNKKSYLELKKAFEKAYFEKNRYTKMKNPAQDKQIKHSFSYSPLLQSKIFAFLKDYFYTLFKRKQYIKYKKHVTGLGHHQGLVSARRPLKTYTYVLWFLTGLNGYMKDLEKEGSPFRIKRFMVNSSGYRFQKGLRFHGRGRGSRADASKHQIVLQFEINKKNTK